MLKIQDLNKSFGKVKALDNLSLEIKEGEFFGFVGPNGSGKTTSMKIIAGLINPDSGTVILDGTDALRDQKALKRKIGYMPDFFGVYDNLKVKEYLMFYASIYGIEGGEARRSSMELLELVDLEGTEDAYVDSLSRGMKQRLCLARILIHDPKFLILDEPASGLDPRARYEMKLILKEIQNRGKTILISSHILPEIAEVCTTLGIIESGRMVLTGTVDEILQAKGKGAYAPIHIRLQEKNTSAVEVLKKNHLVENITMKGNEFIVLFNGNDDKAADLLADMIGNGARVTSFSREVGNLETLFMEITKKEDIREDEWTINGEV